MKRVLLILGVVVGLILVLGAGGYAWATVSSNRILAKEFETHRVDFPIPFPLDPAEVVALGLTPEQADAEAERRAVERGQHLIQARYVCSECHSPAFSGGVMIDAFPIGTILGPNLTTGAGSRTAGFTAADWDRAVRHGVLPDGHPSAMPSEDFRLMSDQELSDIVSYIRSLPPVDNETPARKLGPLGRVLVATNQLKLSADVIGSHDSAHEAFPPAAAATAEFGEHLAATCNGCHGADFTGGPIAGGDPSWAPARNLTQDPSGLGSWTLDDFKRTLREGTRPDGTPLVAPMTFMIPTTSNMSDTELEALWLYLNTVPAKPTKS